MIVQRKGLNEDGKEAPDRIQADNSYRFAYQGQFAEKDQETGFTQFEARLFDNRIGRWMAPDPAKVGFSPYIGVGNNPLIAIDPDGQKPYIVHKNGTYRYYNSPTLLDGIQVLAGAFIPGFSLGSHILHKEAGFIALDQNIIDEYISKGTLISDAGQLLKFSGREILKSTGKAFGGINLIFTIADGASLIANHSKTYSFLEEVGLCLESKTIDGFMKKFTVAKDMIDGYLEDFYTIDKLQPFMKNAIKKELMYIDADAVKNGEMSRLRFMLNYRKVEGYKEIISTMDE